MPAEGAAGPARGRAGREPEDDRWERLRRWWRSRKVTVHDQSMTPEFRPGDRLLIDPTAFRRTPPSRGDVVVVADPAEPGRLLLKRVVGTPGDFVRVTDVGAIRAPRSARERESPPAGALEELEVPPEQVFVLSDRPQHTRDSRQFGPLPYRAVLGRVWRRYAPASRRREFPRATETLSDGSN